MGKSDRPCETSYKSPISRFRTVIPPKEKKSRDPRFDTLSGFFDETHFKHSYSFITDYTHSERQQIEAALAQTTDPEQKALLTAQLNQYKSKEDAQRKYQEKQALKNKRRALEKQLVAQGKKPFFLKKKDQQKELLIERYEQLVKKNPALDVNKFMEKRLKKQSSKQKAKLPFSIRSADNKEK